MTGRRPAELDGPEMPDGVQHIWQWFLELNKRRDPGVGRSPITYTSMAAFFGLYGFTPDAWELRAIESLDDLILKESNGS